MSVTLTVHHCHEIVASTTATNGAPLKISLTGDGTIPHEITVFTDDQVLTDRLIEVINDVTAQRRAETAENKEMEDA